MSTYELEFYKDENGDEPVLDWMKKDLIPAKRRALGLALRSYLQQNGIGVCSSQWGKALGQGLYEFRLRYSLKELADQLNLPHKPTPEGGDDEDVLLRVFFHPHGDKLILLLGGYDKGKDPNEKRQNQEIATARKRLDRWQGLQKKAEAKKAQSSLPSGKGRSSTRKRRA